MPRSPAPSRSRIADRRAGPRMGSDAARVGAGCRRPARRRPCSGMTRSTRATSNGSPASIQAQRLARRGRVAGLHPPARDLGDEDAPVGRVVVDDQRPPGQRRAAARGGSADGPAALGDADREPEGAALAAPARLVRHDRAVHHLRQAAADGQAEARAAVAPAIDASAWLNDWKSRSIWSAGMPMPVSRTGRSPARLSGTRRARPATAADSQHDLAVLGELDRVGQQVEQDLAQPADVADDRPRQVVVDLVGELEALGRGRGAMTSRAPSMQWPAGRTARSRGRPCRPRSWRSRGCR